MSAAATASRGRAGDGFTVRARQSARQWEQVLLISITNMLGRRRARSCPGAEKIAGMLVSAPFAL